MYRRRILSRRFHRARAITAEEDLIAIPHRYPLHVHSHTVAGIRV